MSNWDHTRLMGFDKIQLIYNGCFQLQLYLVFLVCIFFVLLRDADPTKSQSNAATKLFVQPTEWKGSGIMERKRD